MYINKILREELLNEAKDFLPSVGTALSSSKSASQLFGKSFDINQKKEVYRLHGKIIVSATSPPTNASQIYNSKFTIYENNNGAYKIYETPYKLYFYMQRDYTDGKKSFTLMRNHNSYFSSGEALIIEDKDFEALEKSAVMNFNDRLLPLDFGDKQLPLTSSMLSVMYNMTDIHGKYVQERVLTGSLNESMGGVYFYIQNIVKEFQQK